MKAISTHSTNSTLDHFTNAHSNEPNDLFFGDKYPSLKMGFELGFEETPGKRGIFDNSDSGFNTNLSLSLSVNNWEVLNLPDSLGLEISLNDRDQDSFLND